MKYEWFKLFHDMPDDIKLRKFTPQEKWAWVCLMCLASKSTTRGVIFSDDEDISDYCEFNSNQDWLYYRDKLIAKGMLEIGADGGLHLLHWEDRQFCKPSDRPEAINERVKRHRAKKKAAKKKVDETPCNALHKKSNADETPQIRSDKNREDKIYSYPLPLSQSEDIVSESVNSAQVRNRIWGKSKNDWIPEILEEWIKVWAEANRNPGPEGVNLKSFVRKNLHPNAPAHGSMLDELSTVEKRLRAKLEKAQSTPKYTAGSSPYDGMIGGVA